MFSVGLFAAAFQPPAHNMLHTALSLFPPKRTARREVHLVSCVRPGWSFSVSSLPTFTWPSLADDVWNVFKPEPARARVLFYHSEISYDTINWKPETPESLLQSLSAWGLCFPKLLPLPAAKGPLFLALDSLRLLLWQRWTWCWVEFFNQHLFCATKQSSFVWLIFQSPRCDFSLISLCRCLRVARNRACWWFRGRNDWS